MIDRIAWRRLAAEVALPIILLTALELGFRAHIRDTPSFPLPHLTKTTIDTGKYLAFTQMESRRPPLDVVFLGISPMMRVDGRHLQTLMAERWQRPFRSFNFAAPFHSVELDRRLLNQVVLPIEEPAVVVYGLNPLNLLNEPDTASVDIIVSGIPAFSLQGRAPGVRLFAFLLRHVKLLEYREVVRDQFTPWSRAPADPWAERARQTNSFGDLPLLKMKAGVKGVSAWERKYITRFKKFDALLDQTRIFTHLKQLAEFCRDHGIRLVALASPVHPLFMELLPAGREDYESFRRRLRTTAEQAGIPFFDPADGGIGRPELFQDTHHHNQAGSAWLSERIGEFLVERGLLERTNATQRSTTG